MTLCVRRLAVKDAMSRIVLLTSTGVLSAATAAMGANQHNAVVDQAWVEVGRAWVSPLLPQPIPVMPDQPVPDPGSSASSDEETQVWLRYGRATGKFYVAPPSTPLPPGYTDAGGGMAISPAGELVSAPAPTAPAPPPAAPPPGWIDMGGGYYMTPAGQLVGGLPGGG